MRTSTDMHQNGTWARLSAPTQRMLDEVWLLSFAWVTRPKTPADFTAFLALECHCPPRRRAEPDHAQGQRAYARSDFSADGHPRWYLFSLLLRVFDLAADQDDAPDDQRLRRVGRRALWPRSRAALLPHGPDNTLHGLLQWFEQGLHPRDLCRLYLAYDILLTFCHPLTLPRMVTSERFLTHVIIEPIYSILKLLRGLGSPDTSRYHRGAVDVMNLLVHLSDMIRNLTLQIGNGAERAALDRLAPQRLFDAYEAVMTIGQLLSTNNARHPGTISNQVSAIVPRCTNNIAARAVEIVMDCPGQVRLDPHNAFHQLAQRQAVQRQDLERSRKQIWDTLIRVLLSLANEQCCAVPGCTATSVDARLRACAGCRRFLYCSRACQRCAWRHGAAPHREGCRAVAGLYKTYRLPDDHLRAWSVEHDVTPAGSGWVAAATLVTAHLHKLTELRLAAFAAASAA
jgi:hypothetical protein